MNYRMTGVALLGMLMTMPVGLIHADDQPSASTSKQDGKMDPAKWRKKLGLTDDQVAKLKSVREAQKAALKPLWDKEKDLMKKLRDQVKSKAADADIQATLDDMKTTHKAIMDQMEQFRSQKTAILTPTQQAKMLLARMKHHHQKDHDDDGH